MAKNTNYAEQIKLCDDKIAFYKAKKAKLKAEQQAEEHSEMLALLKENKISATDLAIIINEYVGVKKTTDKEITINA